MLRAKVKLRCWQVKTAPQRNTLGKCDGLEEEYRCVIRIELCGVDAMVVKLSMFAIPSAREIVFYPKSLRGEVES